MEERGVSVLQFNFLNMFSPDAATIPGDPRIPSFLDLQMCLRWEDALLAFVYQQPQLESQWKYLCIISDPRFHQGWVLPAAGHCLAAAQKPDHFHGYLWR